MERGSAELSAVVTEADTAARYGGAFPEAAATPFVLGLSEVACHNAVASELAEDQITVGLAANVRHLAPTPVGQRLTAFAREVGREGSKVSFEVEVHDPSGICATVEHWRAIVARSMIEARLAERVAAHNV